MIDQLDKMTQTPPADILLADAPGTSTINALVKDINELTVQLREKAQEITNCREKDGI